MLGFWNKFNFEIFNYLMPKSDVGYGIAFHYEEWWWCFFNKNLNKGFIFQNNLQYKAKN
jgi:hypothetical protein